ncbi:hypothetical protein [Bradyrhizobium jicamae]|nr:hypothetical protein [Bradyrhizobium jicamae]
MADVEPSSRIIVVTARLLHLFDDGGCDATAVEIFLFAGSTLMWVLMYVFSYSVSPAATSDKAEWRLLPTVVFQEFTSEERCSKAKATLEGSLQEAGARLKSGLEDLKAVGKADPAQIIIAYNVECLPK